MTILTIVRVSMKFVFNLHLSKIKDVLKFWRRGNEQSEGLANVWGSGNLARSTNLPRQLASHCFDRSRRTLRPSTSTKSLVICGEKSDSYFCTLGGNRYRRVTRFGGSGLRRNILFRPIKINSNDCWGKFSLYSGKPVESSRPFSRNNLGSSPCDSIRSLRMKRP